MKAPTTSIRHTGIVVHDIDEWVHFLVKILGFKLLSDVLESGSQLDSSLGLRDVQVQVKKFIDVRDSMIEVLCFKSHLDPSSESSNVFSLGIRHIALTVTDIEQISSKFHDRYADPQGLITKSSDGCVKMTYIKGPEGCLFELVEEIK